MGVDRSRFLTFVAASISITCRWRGNKTRSEYVMCRRSSKNISRAFRGYMCRARLREERLRSAAAALIQKVVRGHSVRVCHHNMMAAGRAIQTKFRGYSTRWNYFATLDNVVMVQQFVRMWDAVGKARRRREARMVVGRFGRKVVGFIRARMELEAQGVLSRFWRTVRAKSSVDGLRLDKMGKAAVLIVSCLRIVVVRAGLGRKGVAASKIQTCFRGYSSRWNYYGVLGNVILLQSQARMWEAERMRRIFGRGVVGMQGGMRGWVGRRSSGWRGSSGSADTRW